MRRFFLGLRGLSYFSFSFSAFLGLYYGLWCIFAIFEQIFPSHEMGEARISPAGTILVVLLVCWIFGLVASFGIWWRKRPQIGILKLIGFLQKGLIVLSCIALATQAVCYIAGTLASMMGNPTIAPITLPIFEAIGLIPFYVVCVESVAALVSYNLVETLFHLNLPLFRGLGEIRRLGLLILFSPNIEKAISRRQQKEGSIWY